MPDPRQRTFFAAPQSLRSLTAAILEPLLVVLTLAAVMAWHGKPWRRPEWVLTLLALTMGMPTGSIPRRSCAGWVRHKVRPGITGWAQVNGLRGETDTLDKMRMPVEYDLV